MAHTNKPVDSFSSSGPVAPKVTKKKFKKSFAITISFAALFLLLLVYLVIDFVFGADSFTESSFMPHVFAASTPSMQPDKVDVQSDPQSLSPDMKDRMVATMLGARFIMVKVQDGDTVEPILSAETIFTMKREGDTHEGNPPAENDKQITLNNESGIKGPDNKKTGDDTTGNNGKDQTPIQLVSEEEELYKIQGSSDENGIVRLKIPNPLSGQGYLVIRAPGYRMKALPLSISEGASLDLGVVHLDVEWRVYGRVTDLEGKPIKGAEVKGIKRISGIRRNELIRKTIEHQKTTDAEGCFNFSSKDDVCNQWFPQTIRADAVGYATCFIDEVDEKSMPIVISLAEGREIRGRVVWSSNETPIAGIRLICTEKKSYKATLLEAVTNEEGRFIMAGFPEHGSSLAINISGPKRSPDMVIHVPQYVNDLGDIVVEGPVTVDVTVFEKGSNHPVQGAVINSGIDSGFNFKTQFTDENGHAIITGIPSGSEFCISTRAHGYNWNRDDVKRIITGPPGSHYGVQLELERKPMVPNEFKVFGKVINRHGCPIPDAEITLYSENRDYHALNNRHKHDGICTLIQSYDMADESGSFEILMNEHRWVETIVAEHPQYMPFKANGMFLNEAIDREITITLNDIKEWFYGRVRTDEGTPVNGASVEIEYRCAEGKEIELNHRFNYSAISYRTGLFALPYLAGMKYTLQAKKEHEKSKPLTGLSEKGLIPGASCAELVFSTKDNLYVQFSCKRSSGAPLVDFFVNAGAVSPSAVTDFRGEAIWEHLDNQTYCLNVYDPNNVIGIYGIGVIPVPEQDRWCRFEMIPGRFVEVKVTLSLAGEPFDGQTDSVKLQFEEQKGVQWESPATSIPSEKDKMIEWERSIKTGNVYIEAATGNPIVSFVTYLYEGVFRVKLNALGFEDVLSEPFAIAENSKTLRMNFTLHPL